MGHPEELRQAEMILKQFESDESEDNRDHFIIAEIKLSEQSPLIDQTLADARFRQKHGATVVGIRRGESQIVAPGPAERLLPGDDLIIIGGSSQIEKIKQNKRL